jgi:glycerophosphoryl diester phosphodiesterase
VERIAHRGAKREFPENTLSAFVRAFERGADAVELDVHGTKDGVVIVHHDPLIRLESGAVTTIAGATWADIKRDELVPGIGVPRLIDVLAIAPTDATVYVEIKGASIEEAVAQCIEQSSTRCAVHSFDHGAIRQMQAVAPNIPRGILFENDLGDMLRKMEAVEARDVWPHWRLIDDESVVSIHAAGGRVIAWTVNDAGVARQLVNLGVDGICGDDVRLFDHL